MWEKQLGERKDGGERIESEEEENDKEYLDVRQCNATRGSDVRFQP